MAGNEECVQSPWSETTEHHNLNVNRLTNLNIRPSPSNEAGRIWETPTPAALALLQTGQVADTKNDQTVSIDIRRTSATHGKLDHNRTVTDWIAYLTNDKECMFSQLNYVSNNDTILNKALVNDKEMAPLLPPILHVRTDNCNSCQDMNSVVLPESTTDNEKNVERELIYKKKCSIKAGNCQSSLILVTGDNRKRRVTFSDESKKCCIDDLEFSSLQEKKVIGYVQNNTSESCKSCLKASATCYLNNSDVVQKEGNHNVQSTRETLTSQVLDSQPMKAITDINNSAPVTPDSTMNCVPVHGVILPLDSVVKEKPRMFLVIPLFGQKEKLSRRQLFQIVGMMALGFIFVIVIIVWVFSPALF